MIESPKIKAAIFDYARTLYDMEKSQLYPGATDLLGALKNMKLQLAVVSRGDDVNQRREEFRVLDFPRYFEIMQVVGRGGRKDFSDIFHQFRVNPEECIVVGDRKNSEILEGNKAGCITIWVKYLGGKFVNEPISDVLENPDYTVATLSEVLGIVQRLNQL